MMRFFSLIAARPDISLQEFHDHWRHPHGTLGRRMGMQDYVQAHRVESTSFTQTDSPFHGVAISGWDSLSAALAALGDTQYTEHVRPDEPAFQDLEHNVFLPTTEEVIDARRYTADGATAADALWSEIEAPVSIQLLQFVRSSGSPEWAGADDVSLGRELGAFRHARNTAIRTEDERPFAGVRQLWWPTLDHFERGVAAAPAALETLRQRAKDDVVLITRSERWYR